MKCIVCLQDDGGVERDDHGHQFSELEWRMARVESVQQPHHCLHQSPVPPPQGVNLSREPSPVRQAESEEEVVLPQGLGMDAQVPPTNMEDEVGGQQGLERVVEEEVWPTKLDDEVDCDGQLALSPHRSLVPPPHGVHFS